MTTSVDPDRARRLNDVINHSTSGAYLTDGQRLYRVVDRANDDDETIVLVLEDQQSEERSLKPLSEIIHAAAQDGSWRRVIPERSECAA